MTKRVSFVARVINKIVTANKNVFLEIESSTKKGLVFIGNQNKKAFKLAGEIFIGGTIKVLGKVKRGLVFANELVLL